MESNIHVVKQYRVQFINVLTHKVKLRKFKSHHNASNKQNLTQKLHIQINIRFGAKTSNYVPKKLSMQRIFFTLQRILQCISKPMRMITNYSIVNGHLQQLRIFASLQIYQKNNRISK